MKYLKNVVTLELDERKCTGCGMCLIVCPHQVFVLESRETGGLKRARIQDKDACMECGACSRNCPAEAISVRAGVGCAAAIINGKLKGTQPVCSCGECEDESTSCCG